MLRADDEDNSYAEEDDQKSSQDRAHFPTLMSAPVEAQVRSKSYWIKPTSRNLGTAQITSLDGDAHFAISF